VHYIASYIMNDNGPDGGYFHSQRLADGREIVPDPAALLLSAPPRAGHQAMPIVLWDCTSRQNS
jgi:hypothetical protein